ncbi:hypothetical protein JHK86_005219 [Glycine max]|nr:hypothetical protein JHK86_005219 [Glycine max]
MGRIMRSRKSVIKTSETICSAQCRQWSGGLGIFMGLFLGALDKPLMQEEMTGRQQLIYQAKQMGRRRWSSAKAFAVMGCIFSAAESVVEKVYWI